jgi:hypothetical protein
VKFEEVRVEEYDWVTTIASWDNGFHTKKFPRIKLGKKTLVNSTGNQERPPFLDNFGYIKLCGVYSRAIV